MERLDYHLQQHKGFTAKASDWKILFTKEVESKSIALTLERKIKKRGASRFLLDSEHDA